MVGGGTKRLKGSLLFARSSRSPFCQFGIPFVGVVVVVVVVQLILISFSFLSFLLTRRPGIVVVEVALLLLLFSSIFR